MIGKHDVPAWGELYICSLYIYSILLAVQVDSRSLTEWGPIGICIYIVTYIQVSWVHVSAYDSETWFRLGWIIYICW